MHAEPTIFEQPENSNVDSAFVGH